MMAFTATETARRYFRANNNRVDLKELYAHMAGQAAESSVRETSKIVERLIGRGELKELPGGQLKYTERVDSRTNNSEAVHKMWRGAHQLSIRHGWWGTVDLYQVSGVARRNCGLWLSSMVEQGFVERRGQGPKTQYRISKNAPSRDNPPPFRWPRRGKAKTSKDIQGV